MSGHGLGAVVLAGSHRWSGSTFEKLAPRPLVPIALSPLIAYPLRWLQDGGISNATICENDSDHVIETALGHGVELYMRLSYYRDLTPRGPAGCVRDAGLRTDAETLVVTGGTAVPTIDFAALIEHHRRSNAAATAVVHRQPPSAAPTPGAVYVFERRVLDHVAETGFQDIKENLIPKLRRAGERVVAYESGGFCLQVLNAQTYLSVNQWMLQRLAHHDGAASLIDSSAVVEPGGRLVGPVQLGAGVRLESGATVVGPTSIGPGSTIGRNALIARSVVWNGCVVGEDSIVHGCVVGSHAVVPPGTLLFNLVRAQNDIQPGAPRLSVWGYRTARPGSRERSARSGTTRIPVPFPSSTSSLDRAFIKKG